jgi:hypothetical protein
MISGKSKIFQYSLLCLKLCFWASNMENIKTINSPSSGPLRILLLWVMTMLLHVSSEQKQRFSPDSCGYMIWKVVKYKENNNSVLQLIGLYDPENSSRMNGKMMRSAGECLWWVFWVLIGCNMCWGFGQLYQRIGDNWCINIHESNNFEA